eukprot:g6737.t1
MATFVKVTADTNQTVSKIRAREERFKKEAQKPLPPKPKRSFAHPGGKVTHNKEAALAAYLKRKKGRLTDQQKAMLANLEKLNKKKCDENKNVDNNSKDVNNVVVAKEKSINNDGTSSSIDTPNNIVPPTLEATSTTATKPALYDELKNDGIRIKAMAEIIIVATGEK